MKMAGDGLRRLCRGGGWSYGALWCYDSSDPRLLVLEEGYHEEQCEKIFEVFNQVHVVGQGIIGEVAISGKHQWIIFDTICVESNEISSSFNNPDLFQVGPAEWQHQVLAGIQTIAVIPLPSWGVLQLGSTHKIRESSDSIAQAQHLLWQSRIKQHGCLHVDMSFSHPQDIDFCPNMENNGLSIQSAGKVNTAERGCDWNLSTVEDRNQLVSDNDLFDEMEMEMDLIPTISRQECWDFRAGDSDCISELEMGSVVGSGKGLFSDSSCFEQLLDAVVAGKADVSATNSAICQDSKHGDDRIPAASPSKCGEEKMAPGSLSNARRNSALHQTKKSEESAKVVRKRARQGEGVRPRPKDRQQIQDRVKELREIVPNGAKCSIDSLLDRTIKHMLYLQSVTKYVDKLKQADEPNLIGEDIGVVLKDNTNGGVGGSTWAYEVTRQTMVCPIMVEDVHNSGQMLVEMLCEERGFFLEIADLVRGFGLTILKGDIEIHERKVWARFLVEANRDVTRMDIFLSLVQFLQQTSSFRADELHSRAISTELNSFSACQQQSTAPIPIGLAGKFH